MSCEEIWDAIYFLAIYTLFIIYININLYYLLIQILHFKELIVQIIREIKIFFR